MNLNQSNIDRALGDTPASFSACMQSTLNHCVEARRAPRRLTARTLILAAALVLFCGAAVAMVSAHGLDWWMNNRWLYIQEFNPDLYARIKTSMQKQIEQSDDQPKNNVTVRVQDAAWLADQAFFAIQAVCDNPDYEMHPEFNFDVDGGLSDDPNANEEDNHYRVLRYGSPYRHAAGRSADGGQRRHESGGQQRADRPDIRARSLRNGSGQGRYPALYGRQRLSDPMLSLRNPPVRQQ